MIGADGGVDLLRALAALVLVGTAASAFAKAIGAAALPFYLLAGFLLPRVSPIGPEREEVEMIFPLALAFLLFSAGSALNPARLVGGRARAGALSALGGTVLVGLAGAALATLAGVPPVGAAYFGAAAAFSSTLLGTELLGRSREARHAHGRLAVAILLAQDALLLLLLAVLPALPVDDAGVALLAARVAGAGLVAASALALQRLLPSVFARFEGDPEAHTLVGAGTLFGLLLLTALVGLPPAVGALLAGYVLAPFPANVHARTLLRAGRDLFTPLFFVALGASVPVPGARSAMLAGGLLLLILVAKPLAFAGLLRAGGQSPRVAASTALLLATGSELSLALAVEGAAASDVPSRDSLAAITLAVAASLALVSVAPRARLAPALGRLLPALPVPEAAAGPGVVLLGGGVGGVTVAEALRRAGRAVTVVDHDPHVEEDLPPGMKFVQGDATDPETLKQAGVGEAEVVVAFLHSDEDALAAARALPDPTRLVARIHSARARDEIERLGARVVLAPEAAARCADLALRAVGSRASGRAPGA